MFVEDNALAGIQVKKTLFPIAFNCTDSPSHIATSKPASTFTSFTLIVSSEFIIN